MNLLNFEVWRWIWALTLLHRCSKVLSASLAVVVEADNYVDVYHNSLPGTNLAPDCVTKAVSLAWDFYDIPWHFMASGCASMDKNILMVNYGRESQLSRGWKIPTSAFPRAFVAPDISATLIPLNGVRRVVASDTAAKAQKYMVFEMVELQRKPLHLWSFSFDIFSGAVF